jgi:hypothetical protein
VRLKLFMSGIAVLSIDKALKISGKYNFPSYLKAVISMFEAY